MEMSLNDWKCLQPNQFACRYVAVNIQMRKHRGRQSYAIRNQKIAPMVTNVFQIKLKIKLCALILAFSWSGMALTRSLFTFVRNAIVKDYNWRGDHWLDLITSAFGKPLDEGRVKGVSNDIVDQFLVSYERLQDLYSFSANYIITADTSVPYTLLK